MSLWSQHSCQPVNTKSCFICISYFFIKILFIYSWETYKERQRHRQREKQAPHREPDVGLNTWTGDHTLSWRQTLSHPGIPQLVNFYRKLCWDWLRMWIYRSVWGRIDSNIESSNSWTIQFMSIYFFFDFLHCVL